MTLPPTALEEGTAGGTEVAQPDPRRMRARTRIGAPFFEDGPRFRPEIQALRTIAVMSVVLFHLSPHLVPGGFIGVDVFFVISGFLITSHLLRDAVRKGRPPLGSFWLRRVRRLLPAAFLVLAVTLVSVLVWVPAVMWRQFLSEVAASTLYVENWVLAANSVDYFAEGQGASPVQHYWSLSTEEQFYLVWPLLLTLLIVLSVAATAARRRLIVAGGIGVVLLGSLAYSAAVATEPYGYFSTFTHAWEFASGGLLALFAASVARWLARVPQFSSALAWVGYALIIWSVFAYSGATPFPGVAALVPVAGTIAVIAAGTGPRRLGPDWLVARRPVQWTGDVSYSLYLWHWPPIILLPYITGHDLTTIEKVGILVGAFVLAGLTKAFVEDRFRTSHGLSPRMSRQTVVALVAASAVLVAASVVPIVMLDRAAAQARAEVAQLQDDPCFGAASMLSEKCSPEHVVTPALGAAFAREDRPVNWNGVPYQGCPIVSGVVRQCVWGPDDADVTLGIVGDSHVEQYLPAMAAVAKERGWRVKLMWMAGCRAALPVYDDIAARDFGTTLRVEQSDECRQWKQQVGAVAADDPSIDLIATTSGSRALTKLVSDRVDLTRIAEGFTGMWSALAATGKPVVVLRDNPLNTESVPDCVAASDAASDPCAMPRAAALPLDPIDIALSAGTPKGVTAVDLTGSQCDDKTCHFVVGGVITNYDDSHFSTTFSKSLAPYLGRALEQMLPQAG